MIYILLLTSIVAEFASNINGLPVPVGQIIKYRVPSKYFKRNETSFGMMSSTSNAEGSNSLYDFLSQIHFGGDEVKDMKIATTTLSSLSDDDITESTSYDVEEVDNLTSTSTPVEDVEVN
jgi:hypothetical protein